jgi:hypothetical protein
LSRDDLAAAYLVLPVVEIARHVHPTDRFLAAPLVRLADDEIHVHGLADPVVQMAGVLHVEDFTPVTTECSQIRIAALELDVDFPAARVAVVILELQLAVDAVVEHRNGAEDLVGLAADGHHVSASRRRSSKQSTAARRTSRARIWRTRWRSSAPAF